jgi:outer membrane protein assembly factor BamB
MLLSGSINISMKTLALLLLFFVAWTGRGAGATPSELAGSWTGVLGQGRQASRIYLQCGEPSGGGFSGTLEAPAVLVMFETVTGVASAWPQVRFEAPASEVKFEGKFDAGKTEIAGRWTKAGQEKPLVLRRVASRQRWEGLLGPEGSELPVVLHLGRESSGEAFGAMDSPEQATFGIPASSVTWSNANLQVGFARFNATFAGQFQSADNQLRGEWKQGSQSMPLSFHLTNAPAKTATSARVRRARPVRAAPSGQGDTNWPSYHGPRGSGQAEGFATPENWNITNGQNIRWKTSLPGLGLSAPVIWGNHLYLTTAVANEGGQKLKIGLYGDIGAAADDGEQQWRVLCLDKASGRVLWEKTAHTGRPKIKRHTKASHANATVATDGPHVVAHFGSEGLYCYDTDGALLWKKDFGVLDSGYYAVPSAQWGYGNSPVIHDGRLIIQCDVQTNSFIAAYDLQDGRELWRTPRAEGPSWCTPTVAEWNGRVQIVCNGYHVHAGYEFATGRELWRFRKGGDIPVPTPVVGHGLAFLTSAHGRLSPIYAVRLSAEGDVTLPDGATTNAHIAWSVPRGGSYLQTPVLVGDELYLCNDLGILSCYDARTGRRHYQERLTAGGIGFTASPVAADGKIYCTAENGQVYVAALGTEFERLAKNSLGDNCLTTPALSAGTLYFRTQGQLIAVAERPGAAP